MRNRILNLLRNLDNETELKNYIFDQAIDAHEDIEEHLFSKEFMKYLTCAMEKLTPRQREIFDMSRNQDMSHKEIAAELGISVNTVQDHLSEALKFIKVYFSKHADISISLLLAAFILYK